MGGYPGPSWTQQLVWGLNVTQFPWNFRRTNEKVSWGCWGIRSLPGAAEAILLPRGEGLPESGGHSEGWGGPADTVGAPGSSCA